MRPKPEPAPEVPTPRQDDKNSQRKRLLRGLGPGGVVVLALACAAVGAFYWFVGCPIRLATGIPCPGCGMIRAVRALFTLDISAALYCHPLVFTLPLLGWAVFGRRGPMANRRFKSTVLWVLLAAFILVWVLRVFVFHSPVVAFTTPWPVALFRRLTGG